MNFGRAVRAFAAAVFTALMLTLSAMPAGAGQSTESRAPENGWVINGNGDVQWAGGCAGEFWNPTVDAGTAHYGGKMVCTEPVDQSLTFTFQRCNKWAGVCWNFSDVDEVTNRGVGWSLFAQNYVGCESGDNNTYRIEVLASAKGVSTTAISDEIEIPCYISDL